jgi:hypothetical protein
MDMPANQDAWPKENITTNIGTTVLFENARVRVWEMILAPGTACETHRHTNDYVFVYVTDDNDLVIEYIDGETSAGVFDDGYVQYTVVGSGAQSLKPHRLVNRGTKTHRQILVELLGDSVSSSHAPPPETNGRVRRPRTEEGAPK